MKMSEKNKEKTFFEYFLNFLYYYMIFCCKIL